MANKAIELREFPSAAYDFLRYQIGYWEERDGLAHEKTKDGDWLPISVGPVNVFRLLGFGSTRALAESVARKPWEKDHAGLSTTSQ